MTDRLEGALRALRESEAGASPVADETLARVLADHRDRRRRGARGVKLWLPIAAVLVATTSALAAPKVVTTWRAYVAARGVATDERVERPASNARAGLAPLRGIAPAPASGSAPASGPGSGSAPAPASGSGSAPALAPVSVPAPATVPAAAPPTVPARGIARAPRPPATTLTAATLSPPPSATPSDADVYARAHRLHFGAGDPASALAAWDDYLARFPGGRFVPDARYNRAIDLLKTGHVAQARVALQPFADGAYGDYHRDDARTLLHSLP